MPQRLILGNEQCAATRFRREHTSKMCDFTVRVIQAVSKRFTFIAKFLALCSKPLDLGRRDAP